jgi:hypothetical protein
MLAAILGLRRAGLRHGLLSHSELFICGCHFQKTNANVSQKFPGDLAPHHAALAFL